MNSRQLVDAGNGGKQNFPFLFVFLMLIPVLDTSKFIISPTFIVYSQLAHGPKLHKPHIRSYLSFLECSFFCVFFSLV